MNKILVEIGMIKIHYYSIIMILSFLAGYFILIKEIKKQKIDEYKINDMLFYMVIFSIIGARLYYVIFNLDYYMAYPNEILKIWQGGQAIYGGIIVAVIWIKYYTKKHGLPFLKILDILAVSLIIGQAIGRWGNFFNSEAYGYIVAKATLIDFSIPRFIIDGMYIEGAYHHPTFLYESCLNFLGFIIMITIINKCHKLKIGIITSFYFLWYGLTRFIIEGMRTDSLMIYNFRVSQLVSLFLIILGVIYLIYSFKQKRNYREGI